MNPTIPPRRLPRAERRALLVHAAGEAFGENGYHATSMDDVARRASVSKPVLYRHFDSKLELYVALSTEIAEALQESVLEALGGEGDARSRIHAAVDALFAFVDRPGSSYRMVFASDLAHEASVAEVIQSTQERLGAAVCSIIDERAKIEPEACRLLALSLMNMVESAALTWDLERRLDRERAAALVADVAWAGVNGLHG